MGKLVWLVKPIKPRGRIVVYDDCDERTTFSGIANSYAEWRFNNFRVRSKSIHFAVIDQHGKKRGFIGYVRVESAPAFEIRRDIRMRSKP